ncbi:MAG: hypothetical protein HFJ47_01440 [Clostridia bacterium]|nr:hypothetical protein [Clostridia bacterium]
MKKDSSNRVVLKGIIEDYFKYSHKDAEINFYINFVKVTDRNGNVENIPIIASEYMIGKIDEEIKGRYVVINGSLISIMKQTEKQNTTRDVMILVYSIDWNTEITELDSNQNLITIKGTIYSKPTIRKSYKHICDNILMVVNWDNTKEYISCSFQGTNANKVKKLSPGTKIQLEGRLEKRNKLRLLSNKRVEIVPVHEVRVLKFETIRR